MESSKNKRVVKSILCGALSLSLILGVFLASGMFSAGATDDSSLGVQTTGFDESTGGDGDEGDGGSGGDATDSSGTEEDNLNQDTDSDSSVYTEDENGGGENDGQNTQDEDTLPIELTYAPQPTTAEEALAMWEEAVFNGKPVMWEFELDESLIPEGFYQEFVVVDEETGLGYWTIFAGRVAMAANLVSSSSQFIQLIENAANDSVVDIELTQGFTLSRTVQVNKNITVNIYADPNNDVDIESYYANRHFKINSGVTATFNFSNVTILGDAGGGGFDIAKDADLTVTGGYFHRNKGDANSPGGTFQVAGTLTLKDGVHVYSSNAGVSPSMGDRGGIAYVEATGRLIVQGTPQEPIQLNYGVSTSAGGSVYVAPGGSLYMDYAVLDGSKATNGYGGGISLNAAANATGSQVITNTVIKNSSSVYGGNLHVNVQDGAVIESISNNQFLNAYGTLNGGGAMISIAGTGKINHFENNHFEDNCSYKGGGLSVEGTGTLTITNGIIINNPGNHQSEGLSKVACAGAGVYVENATVNFEGSLTEISGNATNFSQYAMGSGGGGGIAIVNGTVNFKEGNISNNTSVSSGGGVEVEGSGTFIMSPSASITNNVSSTAGGGVYIGTGASASLTSSITGNSATNFGGGIYANSGNVTITDANITDNSSGIGGGIYINNSVTGVKVSGSTIKSNTSGGNGGGIYAGNASGLTLSGGVVESNISNGGGVGIHTGGTLLLTGGAEIKNNINTTVAGANGGGVLVVNGGTLTLDGATISGNSVLGNGGGIAVDSGSLVIEDASITDNKAAYGGGVYLQETSSLDMVLGSISSNNASRGAGIYGTEDSSLTINATGAVDINNNRATESGGGIYLQDCSDATITATGGSVDVSGNTAKALTDSVTGAGGAVYLERSTLNVNNATFSKNEADTNGGAFYVADADSALTLGDGVVLGSNAAYTTARPGADYLNKAGGNGGAVYMANGTLNVNGATLGWNEAGGNGGGVYVNSGTANILDANIFAGIAAGSGGGVYLRDGVLNMQDTNVDNNHASAYGGGLYLQIGNIHARDDASGLGDAAPTVQELTGNHIEGNKAGVDGGGMYVYIAAEGVSEAIANNVLKNNEAMNGSGGGAYIIYLGTGKRVSGNTVEGNKAALNGGGLYLSGDMNRYFAITTDQIKNNTAGNNGGGVYVDNTIFRLYESDYLEQQDGSKAAISGNTAGGNGGGIYAAGNAKVVADWGNIDSNTAAKNGGGIYSDAELGTPSTDPRVVDYNELLVQLNKASVSGNHATQGNGGGVYIGKSGMLELNGSTVNNNDALQGSGGGIYVATYGTLLLHEYGKDYDNQTTIGSSPADGEGTPDANTPDISFNTAGKDGGGIYIANGVLEFRDARVAKNTAGGNGGGIYAKITGIDGASTGNVQWIVNNNFSYNKAQNGGGGYIIVTDTGYSDLISRNVFSHNEAEQNGGGLWVSYEGSGRSMCHNLYSHNSASIRGGGIYITGTPGPTDRFALTNDTVRNNRAQYGGGVFVDNSKFLLYDADVLDERTDEFLTAVTGTSTISENTADYGGGIYLLDSELVIFSGDIVQNAATQNGGGIYANSGSTINAYASSSYEISYNRANGNGGGMYLYPSQGFPVTFSGGSTYNGTLTMQGNTADADTSGSGDGGAVYVPRTGLEYLVMHDTEFSGNTAARSHLSAVVSDDASIYSTNIVSDSYSSDKITLTRSNAHSYNNFDIAYFLNDDNKVTVTLLTNGGRFTNMDPITDTWFTEEHVKTNPFKKPVGPVGNEDEYIPTRANYSFVGWFEDKLSTNDVLNLMNSSSYALYDFAQAVDDDLTLYAAWLAPPQVDDKYTDADYLTGTGAPNATLDVTYTVEDDILGSAVKTGQITIGADGNWSLDLNGDKLVASTDIVAKQTITIPNPNTGGSHTVESYEGTGKVKSTLHIYYHSAGFADDQIPQDTNPYKPGQEANLLDGSVIEREWYEFLYWQDKEDGGTRYTTSDRVTFEDEDVHLYAAWQRYYMVRYDQNYTGTVNNMPFADNATHPNTDPTKFKLNNAQSITVTTNVPTRTDAWVFKGWALDAAGVNMVTDATIPFAQNLLGNITDRYVTLYAIWEETYTLSYHANNATGGDVPASVPDLYRNDTVQLAQNNTNGNPLVRDGYRYMGWQLYPNSVSSSTFYLEGDSYTVTGNQTMYASWKQEHTLEYYANYPHGAATGIPNYVDANAAPYGGYIEGEDTTILSHTDIGLSYTDYTFVGWTTNPLAEAVTVTHTANDPYIFENSGLQLYGVWVENGTTATPEIDEIVEDIIYYDETNKTGTRTISGSGVAGATVTLTTADNAVIGTAVVGVNGKWSFTSLPDPAVSGNLYLQVGDVVYAQQTMDGEKPSLKAETTVVRRNSAKPTINELTEGDTSISGTGIKDSRIVVYGPNGGMIGTATVNEEGKWTISGLADTLLTSGAVVKAEQTQPYRYTSDKAEATVQAKPIVVPSSSSSEAEPSSSSSEADKPSSSSSETEKPPSSSSEADKPSSSSKVQSQPASEAGGDSTRPVVDSSTGGGGGTEVPRGESSTAGASSRRIASSSEISTSRVQSSSTSPADSSSEAPVAESTPGEGVTQEDSSTVVTGGVVDIDTGNPENGEGMTREELIQATGSIRIIGIEIPMGSLSITGGWSLLSLILALFSLLAGAVMAVLALVSRRREQRKDEERARMAEEDGYDAEDEHAYKKTRRIRLVVSAIFGLIPGIVFLILENLNSPMVFITKWTPFIFILFLLHMVVLIFSFVTRKKEEEEEDDDGNYAPA